MKRTKFKLSETQILDFFCSDAYLTVNKYILQAFGPNKAIFLSNLLNKYKYLSEQNLTESGWFFHIMEEQCAETGMSEYQIRSCKDFFKEIQVVSTMFKQMPLKEFYKVNLANLLKHLNTKETKPLETRGITLKKLEGYNIINNIILNKNNNKYICPTKKVKPSNKEKNEQYLPIARYLSKIVQTNKNIKHTPSQISSWTNDIRRLCVENEVSASRIKSALQWYSNHIGEQYIPVIESGKSLREKFTKLEAAISRQKEVKPSIGNRVGHRDAEFKYREPDVEM